MDIRKVLVTLSFEYAIDLDNCGFRISKNSLNNCTLETVEKQRLLGKEYLTDVVSLSNIKI